MFCVDCEAYTLLPVFCMGCGACTLVFMFQCIMGSVLWSLCFVSIVWSALWSLCFMCTVESVLWSWTELCSQSNLSCCLKYFLIFGSNKGIPMILSCIFLGSYYPRCSSGFPRFWWLSWFWGSWNKHGTECPWAGILLTLFLHDQTLIIGRRQEQ